MWFVMVLASGSLFVPSCLNTDYHGNGYYVNTLVVDKWAITDVKNV